MNFSKLMRTQNFVSGVVILIFLGSLSCGKGSPELDPEADQPTQIGLPRAVENGQPFVGEKNFAYLLNGHAVGKTTPSPWAGFWWPYAQNGIASGAYGGGKSPAGKYDAARGGLTDAQGWEIKHHGKGDPRLQGWWGHCNGWCAASALFPEPHQAVTVNGITFEVGDIKALLTEAAMEVSADFYGNRVDFGQDYTNGKYEDTVPNQYFLVLTNYIGKLNQAVLLDRFTGDQVWNQPLVGYRFEYPKPEDYLGADPQAPNVYRIKMTSTIWWGRDDVTPDVQTPEFVFEDNHAFESRTLRMELWLDGPVEFDANGKIKTSGNLILTRKGDVFVGGVWRNGEEGLAIDAHPDYMWIPYSVLKPSEYANAHIDVEWLRKHILSGGVDDPSVRPSAVPSAPVVSPRPNPSWFPEPTSRPTGNDPIIWPTANPRPTIRPEPGPGPAPDPNPRPTRPGPGPTWFAR